MTMFDIKPWDGLLWWMIFTRGCPNLYSHSRTLQNPPMSAGTVIMSEKVSEPHLP